MELSSTLARQDCDLVNVGVGRGVAFAAPDAWLSRNDWKIFMRQSPSLIDCSL